MTNKYSAFYDKPNLSRTRDTMPQVDSDKIDEFLIHFSNGAGGEYKGVEKVQVRIGDLNPSQSEIDEDKVNNMEAEGYDWRNRSYIISKDGYIIDGHHAYALGLLQDPDCEVTCYRVKLDAKNLLRRTNQLKITRKETIDGEDVVKASIFQFFKSVGSVLGELVIFLEAFI